MVTDPPSWLLHPSVGGVLALLTVLVLLLGGAACGGSPAAAGDAEAALDGRNASASWK
jgi:hypothetical protein